MDAGDSGTGDRFRWQRSEPAVARLESLLLGSATLGIRPGSVLEVGCGEGANLAFLAEAGIGASRHGLDVDPRAAGFAACSSGAGASIVTGDARALPYRGGIFDLVLARDLLHHVAEHRARVVEEMKRVCRPGGHVVVVESNPLHPVVAALAIARPGERGMLSMSPGWIARAIGRDWHPEVIREEPSTLARIVWYRTWSGRIPPTGRTGRIVSALERMARVAEPRGLWAYLVVRGRKPGLRHPAQ